MVYSLTNNSLNITWAYIRNCELANSCTSDDQKQSLKVGPNFAKYLILHPIEKGL